MMLLSLLLTLALQSDSLREAVDEAAKLAQNNDWAAAVKTLEDAGAASSEDPLVRATHARYRMRLTEAEIAAGRIGGLDVVDAWLDIGDLLAAVCAMPGAPDTAWVDHAEAMLNSGDLGQALAVVEAGLQELGDSAALHQQGGRVQMAMARKAEGTGDAEARDEHYAAAEASFRAAMAAAPKSAAPCERLGELLWTRYHAGGMADEALKTGAITAWTEAARRDPHGIDLGNLQVWLAAEAVPALDLVVAARPEDPLAYWYRGMAHHAAGAEHWAQLKADFEKVLALNPQFTNAYYFLADGAVKHGVWLATRGGDEAAAKQAYKDAAGYWARYLKDFGGTYRQQLAAQPDGGRGMAEQFDYLAGQLVVRGLFIPEEDRPTGIALLRFAVAVAPDFAYGWQNLGFFLREAGEYEASRDAYARALALVPDDPQVMSDYAVIFHYYLKSDDDKALELYQKAVARAQELLDGGGLSPEDENRYRIALRDARNNIAKLKKGDRRN